MKIVSIKDSLAKAAEGDFINLAAFNDHHFGACSIIGISPVWEIHPDTDEFFYVVEGEANFTLLEAEGAKNYVAKAGSMFVVPKGIWHRPGSEAGMKIIYLTPGQSLHSDADDPRVQGM